MKPQTPQPLPLLRELAVRCRAADVTVAARQGVLVTTWPAAPQDLELRADVRDQADEIRRAIERRATP